MIADVLHRFILLFETSPEIEARPLATRPRTMAAAWGGLLLCKLLSIVIVGPEYGVTALFMVGVGGAVATQVRFRHEHARPNDSRGRIPAVAVSTK